MKLSKILSTIKKKIHQNKYRLDKFKEQIKENEDYLKQIKLWKTNPNKAIKEWEKQNNKEIKKWIRECRPKVMAKMRMVLQEMCYRYKFERCSDPPEYALMKPGRMKPVRISKCRKLMELEPHDLDDMFSSARLSTYLITSPLSVIKDSRKKMKPVLISNELCDFLEKPYGTQISEYQILKCIKSYISKHNLRDPNNKRHIIPEDRLLLYQYVYL